MTDCPPSELARKHRVSPNEASPTPYGIATGTGDTDRGENSLEQLGRVTQLSQHYHRRHPAQKAKSVVQSARFLQEAVKQQLKHLGLSPQQKLPVNHWMLRLPTALMTLKSPVESMNQGNPRPLQKVASGGTFPHQPMYSRWLLPPQLKRPLVFDGSGRGYRRITAEVVGRMLRQLGKRPRYSSASLIWLGGLSGSIICNVKQGRAGWKTCSKTFASWKVRTSRKCRMFGGIDIFSTGLAHWPAGCVSFSAMEPSTSFGISWALQYSDQL